MSAAVSTIYDPSCEEAFAFLKLLYGTKMTEKPKERSERTEGHTKEEKNFAWTFIGMTEGRNSKELQDHIGLRTHLTLWKYLYDDKAMFITPNQFISRNARNEKNLEWLNAIVLDIDDTQNVVEALERTSKFPGRATPALVNQTSKGLHMWYLFDEPVKATKGNQERYIKIARAMAMDSGADSQCQSPVQYFRIPRNIQISQPNARVNFLELYYWAKKKLKAERKGNAYSKQTDPKALLDTEAVKVLLKGVSEGYRNSSAFSLATLFRNAEYSELDGYAKLAEWNQLNEPPMKVSEIRSIVKSVYRKVGDKRIPVNLIRNISGKKFGFGRIITEAKPRDKRKRSHYNESLNDLLIYMESQPEGMWQGSQQALSDETKIPLRSLKEVLALVKKNEMPSLQMNTEGAGCRAKTILKLCKESQNENDVDSTDDSVPQDIVNSDQNGESVPQDKVKSVDNSESVPQNQEKVAQMSGSVPQKGYMRGKILEFVPQKVKNAVEMSCFVPQSCTTTKRKQILVLKRRCEKEEMKYERVWRR